ncbi:hypothetical protein [Microbacterium sp. P5_E9]
MLPPSGATSDGIFHLPAVDETVSAEVVDQFLRIVDALPMRSVPVSMRQVTAFDLDEVPPHVEAFALIVPLLETCLEDVPEALSPALVAQVASMGTFPAIPETIALQIAFGREAGEEQMREIARLIARATRRGLSADEYIAELAAADAIPRGKIIRLFHGETRRTPDVQRMAQGIALLRRIASLVPPPLRPPLLCAIAWLQWARGKRAIAMGYLAEAARIEPEHILAFGLSWLVSTKTPTWIAGS